MDTAHTLAITPRDIKILQFVYAYDTCSAEHLCARFFGASSTPGRYGPQVNSYRRIARLRQAGYLTGYRLPSLTGMGSGKLLLGLGPNGRKLLAEQLGFSHLELRQLKQVITPVLGAHHLAVCDVRLALELACEGRPGISLDWVSERELRNQPITRVKDPRSQPEGVAAPGIPLIPDGQLTITLPDGAEQIFQLEVDLGTIPSKRMQAKLAGYLAQTRPELWVHIASLSLRDGTADIALTARIRLVGQDRLLEGLRRHGRGSRGGAELNSGGPSREHPFGGSNP